MPSLGNTNSRAIDSERLSFIHHNDDKNNNNDNLLMLDPKTTIASPSAPPLQNILPRQSSSDFILPTTYKNLYNSQPVGEIVGITLGAVGGFLFLLFCIYGILGFSFTAGPALVVSRETGQVDVESVRGAAGVERRRKKRRHHRPSQRDTEMFEVRTRERVDILEAEGRNPRIIPVGAAAAAAGRQPDMRRQRPRAARVVEEDDDDEEEEEDEIVVLEEDDTPRRKRRSRAEEESRRRSGGRGGESRRRGEYRSVSRRRYSDED